MAKETIYEIELTRDELEIIKMALEDKETLPRKIAVYAQFHGRHLEKIFQVKDQLIAKLADI